MLWKKVLQEALFSEWQCYPYIEMTALKSNSLYNIRSYNAEFSNYIAFQLIKGAIALVITASVSSLCDLFDGRMNSTTIQAVLIL